MTERAQSSLQVTGFSLKILAILGMTANHVAHAFVVVLPHWATFVLYSFGGLTFPIMAFLIVEGYLHTSNVKRYAIRLGIFALISQIPYYLLFKSNLNVFFTLLFGLLALIAVDKLDTKLEKVLVVGCLMLVDIFCDWGPEGVLITLLFYLWRNKGAKGIWLTMIIPYVIVLVPLAFLLPTEISQGLARGANAVAAGIEDAYVMMGVVGQPLLITQYTFFSICSIGYALIGFTLSGIVLCRYDGQRGRPMKWFFYVYYPLHMLVIWGIKMIFLG